MYVEEATTGDDASPSVSLFLSLLLLLQRPKDCQILGHASLIKLQMHAQPHNRKLLILLLLLLLLLLILLLLVLLLLLLALQQQQQQLLPTGTSSSSSSSSHGSAAETTAATAAATAGGGVGDGFVCVFLSLSRRQTSVSLCLCLGDRRLCLSVSV